MTTTTADIRPLTAGEIGFVAGGTFTLPLPTLHPGGASQSYIDTAYTEANAAAASNPKASQAASAFALLSSLGFTVA